MPVDWHGKQFTPKIFGPSYLPQKLTVAACIASIIYIVKKHANLDDEEFRFFRHYYCKEEQMKIIRKEEEEGLRPVRFRMYTSQTRSIYSLEDEPDFEKAKIPFV